MTQEPQKSNTVLIVIAIIGVIGTIIASAIGAFGSYNTEKLRQEAELTRIAFVSLTTQTAEAKLTPPTYSPVATDSVVTYEPTLTTVPTRPSSTATPEVLSIVGTWKGTTTGTNASGPISERLTTVSIPVDCQVGKTCGFFITEGACNYELTLISIQDNTYNFNTLSVSGESFCTGGSVVENGLKITLRTNAEIYFYYKAGDVMREGILIK
jgi:hypothetical protein